MNELRSIKLCWTLILAIAAFSLLAAPARAQGTPENVSVTYIGTTPNGTITAGTSSIDTNANYDFSFGNTYTITATNVSTLATFSVSAASTENGSELAFSPGGLPVGVYTLQFDNGGDNEDGTDIFFTMTPNLTVVSAFSSPTIGNVSPNPAPAGSPNTVITVTGTGFLVGATVDWNGTALSTNYVSATSLTAVVPASDLLAATTAQITVVNPDTGTTSGLTFTVDAVPTITNVSPNTARAGASNTTITVTGTGFLTGASVDWKGTALTTTYVSATSLTAVVPASDLHAATTAQISVVNSDTGTSSSLPFTVDASPTITKVSPNTARVGASNTTITVTGTGFLTGASVDWKGTPLTTTYVSATSLTAVVPSRDLTSATTAAISVVDPISGTSSSLPFTVDAKPEITSVNPDEARIGSAATTVAVAGTGFASGATVNWNGTALSTTYVSATSLTARIPKSDFASPTTATITVTVPVGGTTAHGVDFTVGSVPIVTSIAPSSVVAGSTDTTVTITGKNFDRTATVKFSSGASLTPTSIDSDTQLKVAIPNADLARAGAFPVTVSTSIGGASSPVSFVVSPLGSFGAPGIKMISVPYDYAGGVVFPDTLSYLDSVSGAEESGTLSIDGWVGGSYSAPSDGLHRGQGYWIREPALTDSLNHSEVLSVMVAGDTAAAGENFDIPLAAGWNLIGDPLTTSVSIASLGVTYQGHTSTILDAAQNGIVGTEFYTYDSSVSSSYIDESLTVAGTTLKPFSGYWVLALSPCTLVVPPAAAL